MTASSSDQTPEQSHVSISTTTQSPLSLLLPLPSSSSLKLKVDRQWIQKLLKKYPNPTTPLDLQHKALVVAPMVDQSDLPFRLLCRQYGSNLAYTPMIHAKMFCTKPIYQGKFLDLKHGTPALDRPLVAQFCGSDPHYVLQAARLVQPFVDGIDINCGCPQNIARRGNYGAFLLEQPDTLLRLVRVLSQELDIPVSVKVRLLPSGVEDSLRLYQQLVDAGASLLTIHGRNRMQKGPLTGRADWNAIRQAVDLLGQDIPIFANGSIGTLDDVRACFEETNVDGVMSSEALLEYPPVFTETNVKSTNYKRTGPGRLTLARKYLQLAQEYPPEEGGQGSGSKCIRGHCHRFLHADMQQYAVIRDKVADGDSMELLQDALDHLEQLHADNHHNVENEQLSWYVRFSACDEQGYNISEQDKEREGFVPQIELMDDTADCMAGLFDNDDE